MREDHYGFFSTTVIGACYSPGFEIEPVSCWVLTVDDRCRMAQVLDPHHHSHALKKAPWTVVQLGEDLVLDWIARLEALDFDLLESVGRSHCVDDMGAYTLYCRFASIHKGITLRSLDWLLMERRPEMVAFRAVWDAIHAVAPIERTRRRL